MDGYAFNKSSYHTNGVTGIFRKRWSAQDARGCLFWVTIIIAAEAIFLKNFQNLAKQSHSF